LVKKGLLGTALGAGTLFLVFGTSAPSYIKTAFQRVRQTAKDSIDPQFEIERARTEIASLQPAFEQNKETLARLEVDAQKLEKKIGETVASLERQQETIVALRDQLKRGDYRLTGHTVGTAEDVKTRLGNRINQYRADERVLKEKRELLKVKQQMIESAHGQLENLRAQKQELLTRLANIEAQYAILQASQARSDFNFDGSALARAKEAVSNLEERLDVMATRADLDAKYGDIDGKTATGVDRDRDVVKEVDQMFGPSAAPKAGEKSL
jgi:chromosome segregation ATPase